MIRNRTTLRVDLVNNISKLIIGWRYQHDVDFILDTTDKHCKHNINSTLFNIAVPTISTIPMKQFNLTYLFCYVYIINPNHDRILNAWTSFSDLVNTNCIKIHPAALNISDGLNTLRTVILMQMQGNKSIQLVLLVVTLKYSFIRLFLKNRFPRHFFYIEALLLLFKHLALWRENERGGGGVIVLKLP